MQLNALDWTIAIASILVAFAPAVFYARRSGKGTAEFFASGRSAPWWLIGTSMVATTFSTDTPNLVTDFVRTKGVAYNWVWWSFLLTGMTTVFFYARLWRRSGVLTDLEFYELRYSGRSASFVRGFRAVYLGLFFNCVIMATVTLAAAKIASVMLGWDRLRTVIVCSLICIPFASASGLWGVLTTDLVQFAIAMFGVTAAAYYALAQPEVGGLANLLAKLDPATTAVLPDLRDLDVTAAVFLVPLLVQWWSVWYPGAEPGGGSYVAQRMLAARSERDAFLGTLWFNVAHYALRPWPWIIVALASMVVFPTLGDIQRALPHVSPDLIGNDLAYPAMLTRLPHGILGVLVASLLAAYVSTMSTHLNWGSSYLVVDVYKRFLNTAASEAHLVWVSRLCAVGLMSISAGLMFVMTTAGEAFHLLLSIGAGTGLLYLLRWFWWRINAWSEIAAMVSSFLIAVGFVIARRAGLQAGEQMQLLVTVPLTTAAWLAVTYLTEPVERERLLAFCRKVRPAGPGWARLRAEVGVAPADDLKLALAGSVLGCIFVYSALFGAGHALLGRPAAAYAALLLASGSGYGLWRVSTAMLRRSEGGAEE